MKRSEALAALSRDHHLALVVAMRLSRSGENDAAQVAERFLRFLAEHELGHFGLEESVLLPAVPETERGRALVKRVIEDHEYLRDAGRRVRRAGDAPSIVFLHDVGSRLRAHVQMEERELFPYLEASLDRSELEDIGAKLVGHSVAESAEVPAVEAVRRFLEAFIERDLAALLTAADPSIELRPLRLTGTVAYGGHDGLRAWFDDLVRLPMRPSFELEDLRGIDGEHVLARVRVIIGDEALRVIAVFTVVAGRVAEAHGYFSDEDTLSFVGVI